MAYIGNDPSNRFVAPKAASVFSGDGSTTAFTLDHAVGSDEDILVSVDGVIQEPSVAYAVSNGTTLTFTAAPSSNSGNNIFVYYLFRTVGTVSHPSNNALTATNGTLTGTLAVTSNATFSGEIITSTSGTSNTRIGENAGDAIASGGNYNVFIGDEAGTAITTGDSNVAVGFEALSTEDAHSRNTAIGHQALKTQDAGANGQSTAVGYNSGKAVTTGIENVFIGASAGESATTPSNTVAIGKSACGGAVLTGDNNTIVGHSAGTAMTSATENVFVGTLAGTSVTSGIRSVAIGKEALHNQTDGGNNVAIGFQAHYSNNGSNNVAIGWQTMLLGTGADNCVAVGREALEDCTGDDNVAIGYQAAMNLTSATECIAIGRNTINTTQTGSNIIALGKNANPSGSGGSDQIVMGKDVTCVGNQNFTFGDGGTDSNIAMGGTSISAPSDERLKEDIKDETVGLAFINELRPVTFQWKQEKDLPTDMKAYVEDSDKRVMNGKYNHGFIAQEVKTVIDKYDIKDGCGLWMESGEDKRQRLAESELIPFLVKAIQELSAEIGTLKTKVAALESK